VHSVHSVHSVVILRWSLRERKMDTRRRGPPKQLAGINAAEHALAAREASAAFCSGPEIASRATGRVPVRAADRTTETTEDTGHRCRRVHDRLLQRALSGLGVGDCPDLVEQPRGLFDSNVG